MCVLALFVQCSFIEYRQYKCIYRRYASLFFIVGVDPADVSTRNRHILFVITRPAPIKHFFTPAACLTT